MTPPRMDQEARAKLVAALRIGCETEDCPCNYTRAAAQLEADGKRIADLEAMEARAKVAMAAAEAHRNPGFYEGVEAACDFILNDADDSNEFKESSDGN